MAGSAAVKRVERETGDWAASQQGVLFIGRPGIPGQQWNYPNDCDTDTISR